LSDYIQLLRNTNFLKLWGSQIFSQVAQNLLFFALIIRVFELAEGTRFANVSVALVVLAFGIPAILFGPLAGLYVDYWNRKWVMVAANISRAGLILCYPLVETNLYLVLALSFIISTINQFFVPAESASMPKLVSSKELVSANALFVFTLYGSFVVGYASSPLAIKVFGDHGPYILTSALLAVAAFLDLMLPTIKASLRRHSASLRQEFVKSWYEVQLNTKTIMRKRLLYFPILQLSITQTVVGIVLALAPALSLALLKQPLTESIHVLLLPAGAGLIAGVITVNLLAQKITLLRVVSVGLLLASTALLLLAMTGLLYHGVGRLEPASVPTVSIVVAILLFVLGFFTSVISSAAQTMLQQATSDDNRGRVFGALGMMVNIAATIPVFMAGILADVFSVNQVLGALGAILVLFSLAQVYGLVGKRYEG
jgi:MFS family permease